MNLKTNFRILKSDPQLVTVIFLRFFLSVFSTKNHVCLFMTQCPITTSQKISVLTKGVKKGDFVYLKKK
jgi:hypothetical protein